MGGGSPPPKVLVYYFYETFKSGRLPHYYGSREIISLVGLGAKPPMAETVINALRTY